MTSYTNRFAKILQDFALSQEFGYVDFDKCLQMTCILDDFPEIKDDFGRCSDFVRTYLTNGFNQTGIENVTRYIIKNHQTYFFIVQ